MPSFQPRYPGAHPSDVPDARPRSLLASPPSETYHQSSTAASASNRNVRHNQQRINGIPPVLYSPEIRHLVSYSHKFKTTRGTCQSIINRSVTNFHFIFDLVISVIIITQLWKQITVVTLQKHLIARTNAVWLKQ